MLKSAWKWTAGCSVFLAIAASLALGFYVWSVRDEPDEADAIYESILRQHKNDSIWRKTHVLLEEAVPARFLEASISHFFARLPMRTRVSNWWEFRSLLKHPDSEKLPYSGKADPILRVIARKELAAFLDEGFTVMSFSTPGFSFDHRRAVVFITEERRCNSFNSSCST